MIRRFAAVSWDIVIWIAVAALFSLLASIGRAECAEPARKPVLMLFTANIDPATGKSWCAPCNRFKADWDADRDNLKTELQSAFRLEVHYVLQEDPRRPAVPSFKAAVPGFTPVVGYTTPDDLLQRLGIRQPDQPRATPGDGQVVREGGSAGEDDLRHLEALQQSVREHRAAINAINDWINGDATGEELDSLRREGASLQRRLVALEEFLSETPWANDVDALAGRQSDQASLIERLRSRVNAATESNAGRIGLSLLELAGLVAAGGVTGGAGSIALSALFRIVRRMRNRVAAETQEPGDESSESPPSTPGSRQVLVPEPRFATVERDLGLHAFTVSATRFVNDYPGAAETVRGVKSYMRQFLESKGIPIPWED